MMTLAELQDARDKLAATVFDADARFNLLARALNVCEEAGELARAERLALDDPNGGSLDAEDAVGDVVIALAGYCTAGGYDLQRCVERAWKQVEARWQAGERRGVPR